MPSMQSIALQQSLAVLQAVPNVPQQREPDNVEIDPHCRLRQHSPAAPEQISWWS